MMCRSFFTIEPAGAGTGFGAAEFFDMMTSDFLREFLRAFSRKSARMYRAITRQIEVTVEPNFMPGRSSPEKSQYFWSYTIVITNSGQETVQLRTRHWIITDASGRKQDIRGEGVVGEQPVLAPGESYEYTSGVPLPTTSGFMTGRYQMVTESGEQFEIEVPTFSLDSPDSRRVLN
jgi:ApaG protein